MKFIIIGIVWLLMGFAALVLGIRYDMEHDGIENFDSYFDRNDNVVPVVVVSGAIGLLISLYVYFIEDKKPLENLAYRIAKIGLKDDENDIS